MKKGQRLLLLMGTVLFLGMAVYDAIIWIETPAHGVRQFVFLYTSFQLIPTALVGLFVLFYGLYLRQDIKG